MLADKTNSVALLDLSHLQNISTTTTTTFEGYFENENYYYIGFSIWTISVYCSDLSYFDDLLNENKNKNIPNNSRSFSSSIT